MRTKSFFVAASALLLMGMAACSEKDPVTPTDPVTPPTDSVTTPADTYVRKHLIEHFTGQGCQYCPAGMNNINQAIAGHEADYIWTSHHTYGTDTYSITESAQLASNYGINAAPMMMLDRTAGTSEDDYGNSIQAVVYHPYYLATNIKAMDTSVSASVHIDKTYDAASRKLTLRVYGTFKDTTVTSTKLTVLLQESGLHGGQKDANTDAGWSDYIHNNVVRAYCTNVLGNPIDVIGGAYTAEYTLTIDNAWNADNCCAVAFITSANNAPVLNAEWAAVVDGTQGGRDIKGGGVTVVAVEENYGEEATVTTETETLQYAGYFVDTIVGSIKTMGIQAYTPKSAGCPFAMLYLNVPSTTTGIPDGTYTLADTYAVNTAIAGKYERGYGINGSIYLIANYAYLASYGQLVPEKLWYLATGTITIGTTTGSTTRTLTVNATTRNGSTISLTYTGVLTDYDAPNSAPAKQVAAKKLTLAPQKQATAKAFQLSK